LHIKGNHKNTVVLAIEMKRINYILIIVIAAFISCKKPYNPPVIASATTYLVVEGVINTGADSTIINLSRTVPLSGANTKNPQTHAIITVENDQNGSFSLTETTPGKYVSPGLNLDNTRKYRLRIRTPDNNQYLSDFVPVNITPPIDSIGFNVVGNNLQIYANAHDSNNATIYYRWDFSETWRFHTEYSSAFATDGVNIVLRDPATQNIFFCFTGDVSSNIILGSTAALAHDVVYQAPITLIASTSEKIELRYSILLHQYALSPEAYSFWQNLKKNTENLGTIFDAQPSAPAGNIHNVANPAEIVIGYVSACTIQSKRVFIDRSQLPLTFITTYPYTCRLDTAWFHAPITGTNQVAQLLIPLSSVDVPIVDLYIPPNKPPSLPDAYIYSGPECADCRIRGSNITPSFWQ
jgi:hypothetical protein